MFRSLLFTPSKRFERLASSSTSTKINSSNALMESVNMAGLTEEYQQVNQNCFHF